MRKKKSFTKAVDTYYFKIKMGFSNNITISRKTKKDAERAYAGYLQQKKNCEWLGKWDGEKFIETEFMAAA